MASSISVNDLGQGQGCCLAHCGELLQGLFEGADGAWHRGLVTLPCPTFCATATFRMDDGGEVVCTPDWKTKACRAAALALEELGRARQGGRLVIRSSFPQGSAGWGLGSSTADVTAAIRAVAAACGARLSARSLAQLAVRAEIAADSLAFGQHALLFAQREGVVLENFAQRFPPLVALGFNTDPAGVDTLAFLPAEYDEPERESFRVLRAAVRRAVRQQDAALLAQAASASARLNQRHLPTRGFDRLEALVRDCGAAGLAVSHSGTAAALLFDPTDPQTGAGLRQAKRVLVRELRFAPVRRFRVGATSTVRANRRPEL